MTGGTPSPPFSASPRSKSLVPPALRAGAAAARKLGYGMLADIILRWPRMTGSECDRGWTAAMSDVVRRREHETPRAADVDDATKREAQSPKSKVEDLRPSTIDHQPTEQREKGNQNA